MKKEKWNLINILLTFSKNNKKIPLLIPGIGTQGGDLKLVIEAIKKSGHLSLHRINSSSGILYAYTKYNSMRYDIAATHELKILNENIEILSEGLI